MATHGVQPGRSGDRPQPGRERIDAGLLGMMGNMNDVKAVARKRQIVGLDESAAPELASDDDVAKDRDSFTCSHGIDCVQLFPEAQMPRLVGLRNSGIDRSRGREPARPSRRITVAIHPIEVNQWIVQEIGGTIDSLSSPRQ